MRYAVLRSVGGGSAIGRVPLGDTLRRTAQLSVVGAILILGGASTQAQPASLPDIGTPAEHGPAARPVAAWSDFCRRMPEECTVDTMQPAVVSLTPAIWRTLQAVNKRVNTRIKPVTDMAHWGVVDRWDFPDDGLGDCEDMQLLKRRMLAARGLSRRALLMTVVIDESGEGHAVLMVRTDRGDMILDNKTNAILSWQRTGYTFVKREGQEGRTWVSLNSATSPVTTANR